jgi:hypothetical protein
MAATRGDEVPHVELIRISFCLIPHSEGFGTAAGLGARTSLPPRRSQCVWWWTSSYRAFGQLRTTAKPHHTLLKQPRKHTTFFSEYSPATCRTSSPPSPGTSGTARSSSARSSTSSNIGGSIGFLQPRSRTSGTHTSLCGVTSWSSLPKRLSASACQAGRGSTSRQAHGQLRE